MTNIVLTNQIIIVQSAVAYSLNKINEKPTKRHLVSTGLYVLNPNVLKLIPKNSKYDFNELIDSAKRKKMKVGLFPIEDKSWNDVGNMNELNKLNLDL